MTETARFDIDPFLDQDEGAYFERKSLYEGPEGRKRARDRRAVRDQVARQVAGFANADGGVLILGIEDDGTVTGCPWPVDALEDLLRTPERRLRPAQAGGMVVDHGDARVVVFDVAASDVPVQVIGDGFPRRFGDETREIAESEIRALKFHSVGSSWESRPSDMGLTDLSPHLLDRARHKSGLAEWTDDRYLRRRKLADRRGPALRLRRAAELVFAEDGPDHANAGVRVFRVVGHTRTVGAEHNVEERPRIEGPLPEVFDAAAAQISGLLRRPSRLVGTTFRPTTEYPDFSWKEALLNALAHRDYSTEGRCVEVWLYDDRMEVISPGALIPEVSLDALRRGERSHSSRNPRLARALADLGYMRDQGEGIPRMFEEMRLNYLPKPQFDVIEQGFRVTLKNTPTLTSADRGFIAQLGDLGFSEHEFRALFEAHRHGRVDNARLRKVCGLDTLQASSLLRGLRDRGLLDLHGASSASYYTLSSRRSDLRRLLHGSDREELGADREELGSDREDLGSDREESGGAGLAPKVPADLRARLDQLGKRPRRERLRDAIRELLRLGPWRAADLAKELGDRNARRLVTEHLTPMVADGEIRRLYPDEPNHPEQAYLLPKQDPEPPDLGSLFDLIFGRLADELNVERPSGGSGFGDGQRGGE